MVPDESSPESIWFIKVKDSFESVVKMMDNCKNGITPGIPYIEARFMEKVDVLAKGFLYKLSKKITFIFIESVVYLLVQFTRHTNRFFLSVEDYVEVLNYVDSNGLPRI